MRECQLLEHWNLEHWNEKNTEKDKMTRFVKFDEFVACVCGAVREQLSSACSL